MCIYYTFKLQLTNFPIYPVIWDQSEILRLKEPTELQMESLSHILKY